MDHLVLFFLVQDIFILPTGDFPSRLFGYHEQEPEPSMSVGGQATVLDYEDSIQKRIGDELGKQTCS